MSLKLFLLLFFSFVLSYTQGEYTEHRVEILSEDKYLLEWWIDYEGKEVKFNVTVKTKGWIGFGISNSGGMGNADMAIGGFYSNGTGYFSDMHAVGESTPLLDTKQDWTLISGNETESHTNLLFSRPFDTCDAEDVVLSNDTTNFIWAYSDNDSDTLSYHTSSNRGSLRVQPLDPQVPPIDIGKFQKYDILHKMVMPQNETTYWCTIHKSPNFTKMHHIVAFEPLLESAEARAHTHHYNIYRCTAPNMEETFEPFVGSLGGECYVPLPSVPTHLCQTMFYNWAVGGRTLVLPENIGYPIGETGSPVDYYMFEIHYNNPDELEDKEFETGVNVYFTEEIRPLDAGLMVVAHHTSISLTVPPNSTQFKIVGHCDTSCTQWHLPSDGINVFAVFLHAHISGRRMKFRHFRGDLELPWASVDDTYDFEFQQTRPLPQVLKILPGDHLAMECTYDTTWNDGRVVIGGLSTKEEMCQAIFWHYPRADLRDCRSEYPLQQLFNKFGIVGANRTSLYDDAVITEPKKWEGKRYTQVLNEEIPWSQDLVEEMQQDLVHSAHEGTCYTVSKGEVKVQSTGYPSIKKEYEPVDQCDLKEDDNGNGESILKFNLIFLSFTFAIIYSYQ